MLKHLAIKNYALIEEMSLDCESGMTVITGETGAGKSMIVEAISALCGDPIDDLAIRTGSDYAEISAVFDLPADSRNRFGDLVEDGGDLIIRRRAERGKRQLSYVNDHLVSLARLKEITRPLIDLVGQYENLSLLYPRHHLALLDAYAGLAGETAAYRQVFLEHQQCRARREELQSSIQAAAERQDLLQHEIREIEQARLEAGEEERLRQEKELLASAEKRAALAADLAAVLYDAEESASGQIGRGIKLLTELSRLDPGMAELSARTENMAAELSDMYRQVAAYRDRIDFSAARLEEIMSRLDLISRLKKKYGSDLEQIYQYLERARRELAQQENRDEELSRLKERIQALAPVLEERASRLTQRRRAAAKKLARLMLENLNRLGMERASFDIRLSAAEPSETGHDAVEFYISTNPGEEIKPLRKVASGGEISRITLALKAVLAGADEIPTIVFDEVDTGIGGRIAEAVGELLAMVSRDRQVICITHLAQISVFAHHHLLVTKEIGQKGTTTKIVKLDEARRQQEIARMIGGREITRKTREHAAEILARGRSRT